MNEVKRYDAGCDYAGEEEMVERADGDFVRHEDYAALKDSAMDYAYRWSKAQDDIKKAHMLHSMQKEEITNLKEQLTATTNSLTNAQEALKSAGIEADTVQAGVMQLKTRLEALAVENDLIHSNPSLASMMDALDKFYEHEHLPETGMLAAYKTLLPKRSPATEAYLNAVRADGLDMAAAEIDRWFGCGSLACEIRQKSAQLRAGNAGKDGV